MLGGGVVVACETQKSAPGCFELAFFPECRPHQLALFTDGNVGYVVSDIFFVLGHPCPKFTACLRECGGRGDVLLKPRV